MNIFRRNALLNWKLVKTQIGAICEDSCSFPFSTEELSDETITDLKHKITHLVGLTRGYQLSQTDRGHLLRLLPTSQAELPPRKLSDSYATAVIPLSSCEDMREKYVTVMGQVRYGRLVEDMDMFSVWVAYKHVLNPKQTNEDPSPYIIVTALVDQIGFTDQFSPKFDQDIRLSGNVSWVGASSMETTVMLEQKVAGEWRRITRATFLMAARNATNTAAAFVNPLVAETDREKEILLKGERRKKKRLERNQRSLGIVGPDMLEQQIIHNLFLEVKDLADPYAKPLLPSGNLWMRNTSQQSTMVCHPEHRNMYNRVYGGFIMRQAVELAWITGFVVSKSRPLLCNICDVQFKESIAIGTLLRMTSLVVFSEDNFLQVVVYADVFNQPTGKYALTNSFRFTLELSEPAVKVQPEGYLDAMKYLDGRRYFQLAMQRRAVLTA